MLVSGYSNTRALANFVTASSSHFESIMVILRRAFGNTGCTELATTERGMAVLQLQNTTEKSHCICRV